MPANGPLSLPSPRTTPQRLLPKLSWLPAIGAALAASAALVLGAPNPARGVVATTPQGLLYGVNAASELVAIDTVGLVERTVGPIGVAKVTALAYDNRSDTLYGIAEDGRLLTVDRGTGTGKVVQTIAVRGRALFSSLAFEPGGRIGRLFTANAVGGRDLLRIDLGPAPPHAVVRIGSIRDGATAAQVTGLASQPGTGRLYAIHRNRNALGILSAATGAFERTFPNSGINNPEGLAFEPGSGTLYGVFSPGTLGTFDLATGGAKAVGRTTSLTALAAVAAPGDDGRAFDARIQFNASVASPATAAEVAAEAALRRQLPALRVEYDATTWGTRSLYNMTGRLSEPSRGTQPLTVALEWVRAHLALLGLSEADLRDFEVTDNVASAVSGTQHVYLRQRHLGLPLYNGQLQVNLDRQRRVISVYSAFLPGLAAATNATSPQLRPADAVLSAARMLGIRAAASPRELGPPSGTDQRTPLGAPDISREPIEARLMLLPIRRGTARLVWNFQLHTLDSRHVYDMTVDAVDGKIWTRFDWVAADTYRVYPRPVESPNHVMPSPPADTRTTVTNPAHAAASPFGWHDTNGAAGAEFTRMQGNNVHAYDDIDANNLPPSTEPDCGSSLGCTFAINLAGAPGTYTPAAVANLFYWNNLIHDVQLRYGFDSAAGNFQTNTYGLGGLGNDEVQAEAQDGGGTNNANFYTPPDGAKPRMQMYLWSTASPSPDGDLDSGIIVHEYGHGISNRLVGGPSNVSCLGNAQQPGEGLSDWWTLVYTHEPGDQGTDPRGIVTYALNQATSGIGLRTQRYSTNGAVNSWTYASINGLAIPHGVGSVWAQAAWEAYWALVNKWGFDPDLYNATGPSGNQRMMLYVNEGLKLTPCSPTFTQVRDGILQAAALHHSGEDVCPLWTAFAAFGLGSDANPVGANSTAPQNGFQVPAFCQADARTRDNPSDAGAEPHLLGDIWNSPDVKLCVAQNCAVPEDPIVGTPAYVYVTLTNDPPSAAISGNLFVYYTAFGGAAQWNATTGGDWTLVNPGGTSVAFTAGQATQVVEIPWNTVPAAGHYCMLTRWVSAQDPMTFPEVAQTTTNVQNNNNISWKNFNVANALQAASDTTEFVVRNVDAAPRKVDLEVKADANFVADGVVLTVRLGSLFNRWRDAGSQGRNVTVKAPDLVAITGTPAAILGLPMNAGERAPIEVTLQAREPVRFPGVSHRYQFTLTQGVGGQVLGGATYSLITRAANTDTDGDGVVDVNDPDDDGDGIADARDADPVDRTVGRRGPVECTLDLVANQHNCGGVAGIELVDAPAQGRALVKLNLDPRASGFDRAVLTVDFGTAPSGWSLNIGDSRSNDGHGGDAGNQTYSAELQILEKDLSIFANDLSLPPAQRLALVENVATAGRSIQVEVADGLVAWRSPGVTGELASPYLFGLAGQRDIEGPVNRDIFAAFNRTITRGDRAGSGVTRVKIRLLPPPLRRPAPDVAGVTAGSPAN